MVFPRRLRTVLQTFDPARFEPANARGMGVPAGRLMEDRAEDVALARSELLTAILFGHEVVVPAGSVADSPAFVELFSEVMEDSVEQRGRIFTITGAHYHPFRIGLEPRFREGVGRRGGYDAFLADYLGSFQPGRIDLRVVADVAAKAKRDEKETMFHLVKAYLDGRLEDIKSIDDRYARHVECVFREFSDRILTPAPPIYSATDQFRGAPRNLYADTIRQSCASAEANGIGYRNLDEIVAATAEVERKLELEGIAELGGARGLWYRNSEMFGSHWQVVRAWIDRKIYGMFATGYEVALPSYFTQKLEADPCTVATALVGIDREEIDPWLTKATSSLSKKPVVIDWKSVWSLVAEEDVQRALLKMQNTISERRDVERRAALALRGADPEDVAAAERDRYLARGQLVADAIEAYVEVINAGRHTFRLDGDYGRWQVTVTQSAQSFGPVTRTMIDAAGNTLFGIGVALVLPNPYKVAGAAFAANFATGTLSNLGWAAGKYAQKIIGTVTRPSRLPGWDDLGDSEKRRLSFWTID